MTTSYQIMLNMAEDLSAEISRLRSLEAVVLKRPEWLEDEELKPIIALKRERFKRLEKQ
ncbi:MAG: hypothetical protein ACRC62_23460 [Microcoleus sp.]